MFTTVQLSAFVGVLLSLILSYVPGLAPRFEALDNTMKRVIVLAILLVACLLVFAASCSGVTIPGADPVSCDQPGITLLVNAFVAAVVGNQVAYLVTPTKANA